MKLLFVTRSIPLHPRTGGMEQVAWDLAKSLSGHADVEVLTTTVPAHAPSFTHDGVSVTTLEGTKAGRYSLEWWTRTTRFSRAKDFDVVLSVSAGATTMSIAQKGPRYIFQAHGTAYSELRNTVKVRPRLWPLKAARFAYWTVVDSFTYRRVHAVIAASEQVAEHLRRWPYGGAWASTDLHVINNAVDAAYMGEAAGIRGQVRRELGFSPEDTVVAAISRLDKQKGVDRVIDAVHASPDGVKLIVGGDGPEADALAGAADPSRVTFLGELDRAGVRDALAAADVFVLPVRNFEREALPLSVLEALASGKRVIVPAESSWPADIAPLLEFVDVADTSKLAKAVAGGSPAAGSETLFPESYTLPGWAARYLTAMQS